MYKFEKYISGNHLLNTHRIPSSNQVHFAEYKVICILKRATCSDGEWEQYEEKVECEMELEELLEDLGKVLEATQRLALRNNNS